MRISDWSSDVCSSDLLGRFVEQPQLWRPFVIGAAVAAGRVQQIIGLSPAAGELDPADGGQPFGDRQPPFAIGRDAIGPEIGLCQPIAAPAPTFHILSGADRPEHITRPTTSLNRKNSVLGTR